MFVGRNIKQIDTMKRTKFFKPYNDKKTVCTLKSSGAGVYIIKQENKIVYIGYSSTDVKKTMYRHFQKWTDLRSTFGRASQPYDRITYHNRFNNDEYKCKVIFCTPKQAELLEQALILKLKPRDNSLKLNLISEMQKNKIIETMTDADEVAPEYDRPF
jgi:predicted GIY-YIG superfamily endonuclease